MARALSAMWMSTAAVAACSAVEEVAPDEGSSSPGDAATADGAQDPSDAGGGSEAGIGFPGVTLPMQKSGARLKRMLLGPVGSPEGTFVGWRDTGRNEDCDYSRTSQLMTRCVPPLLGGQGSEALYVDNMCSSQPVAGLRAGECFAGFIQSIERLPDGGAFEVLGLRPVGAELATSPSRLYRVNPGFTSPCFGAAAPRFYEKLFTVGPAIAASAFVGESSRTRTTRSLTAISATASDGSERVVNFEVAGSPNTPCVVSRHADGTLHCVHWNRAKPLFSTADCKGTAAAWSWPHDVSLPAVVPAPSSCFPDAVAFHEVAPAVRPDAGTTLFEVDTTMDGQCQALFPSATWNRLVRELPPTSYPTVATALGSPGPLQAVLQNIDGYVEVRGWVDNTHGGIPCELTKTSDGRFRCVPAVRARASYLDASCTLPSPVALFDYVPRQCGEPAPSELFVPRVSVLGCGEREAQSVYRGVAAAEPLFDKLSDGRCVPAQTKRFSASDVEVPLQAFTEGVLRTD